MKKPIFLPVSIGMIMLVFSFSCEEEKYDFPDVDEYIQQLKSGSYPRRNLPEFKTSQIPELMEFRNEAQLIRNFPVNPLSSYYLAECRLGIYVLWTIEYIRKRKTGIADALDPWPSLSPVLTPEKDFDRNRPGDLSVASMHAVAATAYFSWWQNEEGKRTGEVMKTNPLKDTGLRWW